MGAKKLVVLTLALFLLIIGVWVYFHTQSFPLPLKIPAGDLPTLGQPNAPVSIVVFEDFKCPRCAEFNLHLPTIKQKYIDPGIAKYSIAILTFIPGSETAGNAALCVYKQNPSSFFRFTDYLFKHQANETENWATPSILLDYAKTVVPTLDKTEFMRCLMTQKYFLLLKQNFLTAERLMPHAIATPTVYVNGILVSPLTLKRLDQLIQRAHPKNQ